MKRVSFEGYYSELVRLHNRINNISHISAARYRSIVRDTLTTLSMTSPQWSGYYASNWRISVAGRAGSSGEVGFQQQVYSEAAYDQFKAESPTGDWRGESQQVRFRGHTAAVAFCLQANEPLLALIRSSTVRVTFRNDTPYAEAIAKDRAEKDGITKGGKAGDSFLRPGNYVDPKPIPVGFVKTLLPAIVARNSK